MFEIGEIRKDKYRSRFVWSACIDCGKKRWAHLVGGKPESPRCNKCAKKGELNYRWKGGKSKSNKGYIVVLQPDGRYRRESRLVVEESLQRPLTDEEVVHHINADKTDNRIRNLALMSKIEHDHLNTKKE